MTNSTVRRRGRHAAPSPVLTVPRPREVALPRLRRPSPSSDTRLPGMELLGFYDEPYQVKADARRPPVRAPRPADSHEAPHHTSRVATLWETTELEEGVLDWWKPQVIARRKLGGTRVRLLTVVAATAALIVTTVLAAWLAQRPSQLAEESEGTLRTHAASLVDSLPSLRTLAMSLGAAEPPDLAASSSVTLAAESAARNVFTDAGTIEESDPIRETAVAGASTVLDATNRINRLVAFRLTAEAALVAPDLPEAPSPDELSQVTERIAVWRSDIEASLSQLPGQALDDSRRGLLEWQAGLEAWQATYLDAVREGDTAAAAEARDSQVDQIASLRRQLRDDLFTEGTEVDDELDEASSLLSRLVGD